MTSKEALQKIRDIITVELETVECDHCGKADGLVYNFAHDFLSCEWCGDIESHEPEKENTNE